MAYKWIAREIEQLDPAVDYERIWKLSTCYQVNNFMFNTLYTIGFPHFILPPWGGETVSRGGTGPLIVDKQRRAVETLDVFWRWFEFGPSSPEGKAASKRVNGMHRNIWKKMPGNFTHNDDFIYTMSWLGCHLDRMRLRLGLPGYTHNQKVATHLYWKAMAELFITETGDVTDLPEDFDAMLDFLDRYEATDWDYSPEGAESCEALFDQFTERWFPSALRPVGRTMILALLDEPAHRVHRLPYPSVAATRFFWFGFKALLWAKDTVLPDPKTTTPERNRRKNRTAGDDGRVLSAA